jgi:hypothetical protein
LGRQNLCKGRRNSRVASVALIIVNSEVPGWKSALRRLDPWASIVRKLAQRGLMGDKLAISFTVKSIH